MLSISVNLAEQNLIYRVLIKKTHLEYVSESEFKNFQPLGLSGLKKFLESELDKIISDTVSWRS